MSSATGSSAGVTESGWSRRESHWHWWVLVMAAAATTSLVEDKQIDVCQHNWTSGDDIGRNTFLELHKFMDNTYSVLTWLLWWWWWQWCVAKPDERLVTLVKAEMPYWSVYFALAFLYCVSFTLVGSFLQCAYSNDIGKNWWYCSCPTFACFSPLCPFTLHWLALFSTDDIGEILAPLCPFTLVVSFLHWWH